MICELYFSKSNQGLHIEVGKVSLFQIWLAVSENVFDCSLNWRKTVDNPTFRSLFVAVTSNLPSSIAVALYTVLF